MSDRIDFDFEATKGGDFQIPPRDMYTLIFDGVIGRKTHPNRENPDAPGDESVYMRFFIDDPEDEDWHNTELRVWFPAKVTAGNKSGKLYAAMLGVEPDDIVGRKIRTSDLVGRRFRATVGENKNGYAEITAPLPLRNRRPKAVVEEADEPPF